VRAVIYAIHLLKIALSSAKLTKLWRISSLLIVLVRLLQDVGILYAYVECLRRKTLIQIAYWRRNYRAQLRLSTQYTHCVDCHFNQVSSLQIVWSFDLRRLYVAVSNWRSPADLQYSRLVADSGGR